MVEAMPGTGSAPGSTPAKNHKKVAATNMTNTSGSAATPLL